MPAVRVLEPRTECAPPAEPRGTARSSCPPPPCSVGGSLCKRSVQGCGPALFRPLTSAKCPLRAKGRKRTVWAAGQACAPCFAFGFSAVRGSRRRPAVGRVLAVERRVRAPGGVRRLALCWGWRGGGRIFFPLLTGGSWARPRWARRCPLPAASAAGLGEGVGPCCSRSRLPVSPCARPDGSRVGPKPHRNLKASARRRDDTLVR